MKAEGIRTGVSIKHLPTGSLKISENQFSDKIWNLQF